ncbi:MAG: hypothetical protein ABH852_03595 [Methanobacteriota archaeon]
MNSDFVPKKNFDSSGLEPWRVALLKLVAEVEAEAQAEKVKVEGETAAPVQAHKRLVLAPSG